MEFVYITGDATKPLTQHADINILCHICNDAGGWGNGFVTAVSNRWLQPEEEYRKWFRQERSFNSYPFKLGRIQLVEVEKDLYVCNMIAQSDPGGYKGFSPIRYGALQECMMRLRSKIEKSINHGINSIAIHMPRIGCGLAGGKWNSVAECIVNGLRDLDIQVFVYDQ